MNRFYILLFTIFFLDGCKSDLDKIEEKPALFLDDWEITKSQHNLNIGLKDMFFIDAETGFIVGHNGKILKTIDSGNSWQEQNSGTTLSLYSVYFLNKNIGFVSGRSGIGCLDEDCDKGSVFLKTINGGQTWFKIFHKDYYRIYALTFFDELNGLAIIRTTSLINSKDHYMAKTSDGGVSWNLLNLDIIAPYHKFQSLGDMVLIAGQNQNIFKTTDKGTNWKSVTTPVAVSQNINNIYFYNKNIGFIHSPSNNYKTIDGGLNWHKIDFPFTNFGLIHFISEHEGFIIESVSAYQGGDFPTFKGSIGYHTTNGGDSWETSELNESVALGLTYFPNHELGFSINYSEFYTLKKKD